MQPSLRVRDNGKRNISYLFYSTSRHLLVSTGGLILPDFHDEAVQAEGFRFIYVQLAKLGLPKSVDVHHFVSIFFQVFILEPFVYVWSFSFLLDGLVRLVFLSLLLPLLSTG